MKAGRTVAVLASAAGAVASAGALAWWALSYWQVWRNDYLSLPQIGRCLVADSTICRLATALCSGQHRAPVVIYSPWLFWTAAALICGAGPLAWLWPSVPQRTTGSA